MTANEIFIHHTAESLRDLEETMPPGVRHIGYDGRGWVILDALWSGPGEKTISIEVNHKPLKLVLESSVPLRVYVNPELPGLTNGRSHQEVGPECWWVLR